MREGILKAGVHQSGSWFWKFTSGRVFTIDYEANTTDLADAYLRVMYALPSKKESFDYRVQADGNAAAVRRFALVVHLSAGEGRPCVRPPRGETLLAAWGEVFRMPALLRLDLHELPGEPRRRRHAAPYRAEDGRRAQGS